MKILETNRLILRHQILEDLDSLWALYNNPDIVRYIPDAPRHPKHPELGLWATIHKETNKFIGRCGLLPWTIDEQNELEVAYLIDKEYWGQGLGTEAAQAILDYGFEKLNLSRLICLIDKENLASIRVAEKIGMSFEKEGKVELGTFLLYSKNKLPAPAIKCNVKHKGG
jgi:RimJ/RimL family protein N-acetyltransferase